MMRRIWSLAILLLGVDFGCVAGADVTVIYRKADGKVAGFAQPPQSVQQEITNVTRSELGGVYGDYATTVVPQATWNANQGQQVSIDGSGTVSFTDRPEKADKNAKRQSGRKKLKDLGLTEPELEALFGP